MFTCERVTRGTSYHTIIITAAAAVVKRRVVRAARQARCRPMCLRPSSTPWRAPWLLTMGEIGQLGHPLTCPRLYEIVALLRPEEDAMTRARRLLPSPTRTRLDSREDTVITSLALPRGRHRHARMAALNLNWTLAEGVREALNEWLVRWYWSALAAGRGGRP